MKISNCGVGTIFKFLAVLFYFLYLWPVTTLAAEYEPDIQSFLSSQTFPAKWLRSDDYVVDNDVINMNFMNHYRVGSRFGVFTAIGNSQLFVRIREIEALEQLKEMSKGRLFVNSASDTVTDTVENVTNAVDDPSGAAEDLGSGLSRLFKRLGRMSKNAFNKGRSYVSKNFDDKSSEQLENTGTSVAKGFLGVNRAYRELARDLRVDPYTRNGVLRAEIEKMASYSAAGSFGVKAIVPVLPLLYGAGYLMTVSNVVYGTHPLDLQLQNEEALRDMGISSKWIQRLMESDRHTPTTQTRIVNSLERLDGVRGRKVLVRFAALAKNISDALFYTRMIELLAMYHQQRVRIDKIIATDRIPVAWTGNRRVVVMAPFDYFRWTTRGDGFVRDLDQQISRYGAYRELWVMGQVSAKSRKHLGALGWAVFDQAAIRI